MIRLSEEYNFCEIKDFLFNNIDVVITGPQNNARRQFVYDSFFGANFNGGAECVHIEYDYEDEMFEFSADKVNQHQDQRRSRSLDFGRGLHTFLSKMDSYRNILIDISSLQTPAIMILLKEIIDGHYIKPGKIFTAYSKPKEYLATEEDYNLTVEFKEPSAMPGLVTRKRDVEKLIVFLGFEGNRLANIIGDEEYMEVIPIAGMPSDDPKWLFESLRRCMNSIKSNDAISLIEKCKAYSIFDAYYLLERIVKNDERYVLSSIGTKPHCVAATIFYLKHKSNCRIVHDYAIESTNSTIGDYEILVTHLTNLL